MSSPDTGWNRTWDHWSRKASTRVALFESDVSQRPRLTRGQRAILTRPRALFAESYEVFVVTDASGTFNKITRRSAWQRMSATGAELMT